MANNFNLGVDESDKKLLEVVPEELTNEELLELEQECTAEEEQRPRKNCRRRKRRTSKKIHSEEFGRRFCKPQQAF